MNSCSVTISSGNLDEPNLDLLSVEEGSFESGEWKVRRRLNGDETARLFMNGPSVWHLRFFSYS